MSSQPQSAPLMVTAAAALIGFGAASIFGSAKSVGRTKKEGRLLKDIEDLKEEDGVDAILILGGGRPRSRTLPPPWVTSRCDLAAEAHKMLDDCPILALSAGTAHATQLLNDRGLPIWESEASALYLIDTHGISTRNVKMETSSYDTMGSAYFARTNFCDVYGWRKLLIVTSSFHMPRCRAIFDWIFNVPIKEGGPDPRYTLLYLASPNKGLRPDIVQARTTHEEKGRRRVYGHRKSCTSLGKVLDFLTTEHQMYKVPYECLDTLPKQKESLEVLLPEPAGQHDVAATPCSTRSSSQSARLGEKNWTKVHDSDFSVTDLIRKSYAVIVDDDQDDSSVEDPPEGMPAPTIEYDLRRKRAKSETKL